MTNRLAAVPSDLVPGLSLAQAADLWNARRGGRRLLDESFTHVWNNFLVDAATGEQVAQTLYQGPDFAVGVCCESDEIWACGRRDRFWFLARIGWATASGFATLPPDSH